MTDEELAQKLARVPDQEIEDYNKARKKKTRILFIIALICGILAVVLLFTRNQTLATVVGIIGIVAIQIGAYKRARWQHVYHNLIYLRTQQLKKEKDATINKNIHGQKFNLK